ncbi:serine/threonine-protein phosphatase 6 regulatory ankyrin repeat subunit B-like isoform X2 [Haliotis rufescens]|nr:serine/threonine-protein phosphatase 6 regulatory ankyrin repeat subunit B-like isoform X2 [Haliotis rufescens]XP_048249072.1 serine/threonine-protein phosphatase 6 regulatory ankyrin repeat subunit B-like isoform X2 [Haliotis rufescens]XP_048249073.1 serine/threonine-protein phosphatase 6 regulatory ankyrin repeat subunit B-like isoform X2 [Haliotis rufescens]
MQLLYPFLMIVILETHGQTNCEWGKYGENCSKDCPSTCILDPVRNLTHCHKETGKCSEGCVPGWFEDLCDHACSKNCLINTCNRQNGICTFGCDGDYTGDFCNSIRGTTATPPGESSTYTSPTTPSESNTETTPDLAAILVPVFLILVVVIAVVLFILFFYKRKRKRGDTKGIIDAVTWVLPCWRTTDTAGTAARSSAGENELLMAEEGGATSDGDAESTCSFDLVEDEALPFGSLEQRLKDVRKVFVKTESFKQMKEKLKTFGHVTISGSPGEGKTSMALMLGAEYRKQGYELVLLEDVDKVQLSDFIDKGKDVCVILDDVLKTVRSNMDLSGLMHFLYDLHVHLDQCEGRSEGRYLRLQQEPSKIKQTNICVIFTVEAGILQFAISKLESHLIFRSLTDVTLGCQITREEKKKMWLNHTSHTQCSKQNELNKLIAFEGTTVRFPLVCKLFSSCDTFQMHPEAFFEKPIFYVKNQLQTLVSSLDDKSAALILVLLSDGQLNISQLESEGASPDLEAHLKAVATLVKTSTRQGVTKAVRGFCGTLLTEGNITTFSHSVMYDVCASIVFNIEPELILKHCSIKFLFEHVQDEQAKVIPVSAHQLTIYLSGTYKEIIVARLADSLVYGAPSKYIMYSIVKREEIAAYLSQMTENVFSLSYEAKHNILHYACVTGNKNILQRLLPHCEINRRGLNGWTPVMYTVVSGQMECFDFLVKHKADITLCDSNKNNLLHLTCQHGDVSTVKHVKREFKKLNSDLNLNSRGIHDLTPVMCAVLFGTYDVLDYLCKKKVDLTLRDSNNNTALHLASRYGNKSTVESLLPNTEINTRGSNGQTPVMSALLSGRKETFDLLVLKKADITLTDADNNNLLHTASHVDDVSMLVQIVPQFDINTRGKHGWTAVMTAAINGKMDAFNILLKMKANLKLNDDTNNNLLHLACHGGNVSIVEILLRKFEINSRGNNGWTPVMFAAASGEESVFNLLVSQGADITLRDGYNNSVFHLASIGGNISIVKYLLPSTAIDCRGNHGRTALMIATLLAKPTLFRLLLSKKANMTLIDDHNDTLLHLACQGGNYSIVKYLLTKYDINTSGRHGRTPVMNATWTGRKDVFDLLVSQEADLTLTDDYKDNVLHMACQGGKTAIVEHLLTIIDIDLRGKDDWTPVLHAANAGQKDVFNLLVSRKADLTLIDDYGNNALHLACQGGNRSIVDSLLPKFDINIPGQDGRTPLMNAVVYGTDNVFNLLLSRDADKTVNDNHNDSVFHLACQGGRSSIVECLLPKKINRLGNHGRTAIMKAALAGKMRVFDLLVTHHADLKVTDNSQDNALHLSCQSGNTTIVEHLLNIFNKDIKGQNGLTPVMYAARAGQGNVFNLLVSRKAQMKLSDLSGNNLLHLACQGGNSFIIKHLLPMFDINTPREDGWTPIMMAALSGKKDAYDLIATRGGNPSLTSPETDTVLHAACQGGSVTIVKALIGKFDINARGRNDETPLMRAVSGGHIAVYKFLVSHKADHTLVDKGGHTLLHLATQHGQLRMVKYIIDSFDINARDEAGLTPVMMSVVSGKVAVFEYLRRRGIDLTLVDNSGNDMLKLAREAGCRQIIEQLQPAKKVKRLSALKDTKVGKLFIPSKKNVQLHSGISSEVTNESPSSPTENSNDFDLKQTD